MTEMTLCKRIIVQGRVQRVGFRKTTLKISRNYSICGYVQNLPTGEVLIVAQGQGDVLDKFLNQLRQEMGSLIASIQEEPMNLQDFKEFQIQY